MGDRSTVVCSSCVLATGLFYVGLRAVVREIGLNFAVQYTLREKARILTPMEREVAFCKMFVEMPAIRDWIHDEENPSLKAAGLREMEIFRNQFHDKGCFLVMASSRQRSVKYFTRLPTVK